MTNLTNTPSEEAVRLAGPFPDKSPFGEIGVTGSPLAYLIDPGAGSASDRVTRFWPPRDQLDNIDLRGGSITPLYALRSPSPDTKEAVERALSWLADQETTAEALDSVPPEWAELSPNERVKILGQRTQARDDAINAARTALTGGSDNAD